MTPAITSAIPFPNSPAQETTFEELEPSTTARNFARMMAKAVMAPRANIRNAAGRPPTDAVSADEEADSEADEISKQKASAEDRNVPAVPPPTGLAGLLASLLVQPIPNPLTWADGQPNAGAPDSLDAVPAVGSFVPVASPRPNPSQTDNSMPSSGKCSQERYPSESTGDQLHAEAHDSNSTGGNDQDTRLGSADQPAPTGLSPKTPVSMGEAAPGGELAPAPSRLPEVIDPIPVFPQLKPGATKDLSALAELSGLAGNESPAVQPGASQAEAAKAVKAASGNTPTAVASASSPAMAISSRALEVVGPTAREPAAITAVSEHGTSAAQHTGTMQATHEMNENAGLAEQNLPAWLAALETVAPAGRERKGRGNAADRLVDLAPGAAEAASALANPPTRHELRAYVPADGLQSFVAEGVRRAIENAAAGLSRIDTSSTSLVLTPDGHTQLALHVKLQQGRFEVLAVLERGDFAALGAEWSQLQNRLANQGVHLAPLVSGAELGNGFSGGQSFFGKRGQEEMSPGDHPLPALAGTAAVNSGGRTVTAANRCEWWA